MKKAVLLSFIALFLLPLSGCEKEGAVSTYSYEQPPCPPSPEPPDEAKATIQKVMEYDISSLNSDENCYSRERVGQYYGCYGGYYSAGYEPYSTLYVSDDVKGGPKRWFPLLSNFYYNEVPVMGEIGVDVYFSNAPYYLWKNRKITTLKEAYEAGEIFMGDILEMALLHIGYSGLVGLDEFFTPDLSEIEAPFSSMEVEEAIPERQLSEAHPTTLREKISAEYSQRYVSFTDRYLNRLGQEERQIEETKPRAWVEKYLGNIGDALVLEMGILGYPKGIIGPHLCGADYNNLNGLRKSFGSTRRDVETIDVNYPLVIYLDGRFYGFSLTIDSLWEKRENCILSGEPCPLAEKDIEEWRLQTDYDDSILDESL